MLYKIILCKVKSLLLIILCLDGLLRSTEFSNSLGKADMGWNLFIRLSTYSYNPCQSWSKSGYALFLIADD